MIEADGIITTKIAREALHFFNADEGVDPGSFFTKFYELASHADNDNLARLSHGFPAEIAALVMGRQDNGLTTLRLIASQPMTVNS